MRIDVFTVFPEILRSPLRESLLGRAIEALVDVRVHDLRSWTDDRHRSVDDEAYGGGPGMVLKPEPLFRSRVARPRSRAGAAARRPAAASIRPSCASSRANPTSRSCAAGTRVDERVVQGLPAEEVSIGDYVLAGVSSRARADRGRDAPVPGVIGKEESHERDSFAEPGVLDHPHYTRPPEFRGMTVPEVLRSGDHGAIERCGARRPSRRRAGKARSRPLAGGQWQGATFHMQRRRLGPDIARGPTKPDKRSAEHHRAADTTVTRMLTSGSHPPARPGRADRRSAAGLLVSFLAVPMNTTDLVEQSYLRKGLPSFRPGDTVKVHVRVVEGNRERVQVFQGVVIRRSGGGLRETFTVRKISFGVGVERTFPLHSPSIAKLGSRSAGTSGERSSTTSGTCAGRRPGSGSAGSTRRLAALEAIEDEAVEELAEEGSMEALEEAESATELDPGAAEGGDETAAAEDAADEPPAEIEAADAESADGESADADASADEAEERAEA